MNGKQVVCEHPAEFPAMYVRDEYGWDWGDNGYQSLTPILRLQKMAQLFFVRCIRC
jgi:hypothetical protein